MLRLLVALGFIASVASLCTDNNRSCPSWAKSPRNYCQTNSYVKKYCQKSCGTCSGGGNGGSGGSSGKCGISKVSQSRVVNGQEAKPGAWPWIVSLQTSRGFHFCGGSILTPNWILTASHCVRGKSSVNVVAGAHDKSQRESTQQKISSRRIIMHPSFGSGSLNYDVALIELSSPLKMNDRVVRACMPQKDVYPQVGKNCYVAGWGRVSVSPSRSPNKLQQARLPILEQNKCGNHFVCTGYGYGARGKPHPNICQGDSGGPLMCQRSDGSWQVEGAASWVLKDCTIYSAYAALHKYLDWVKQYVPNLQ